MRKHLAKVTLENEDTSTVVDPTPSEPAVAEPTAAETKAADKAAAEAAEAEAARIHAANDSASIAKTPKETEEPAVEPAEPVTPSEPVPDSVESKLLDVTESEAEGNSDNSAVEEASDVAEALEAMSDVLADAACNGGLNAYGAQITDIALNHMYKRVGIQKKSVPAMEDFTAMSSRVRATRIALESVTVELKRIWDAIVEAIKKSIEWLKSFFKKMFDAAGHMHDRAVKLSTQANTVTGSAPAGAKLENESFSHRIAVSRRVKNDAIAVESLLNTTRLVFNDFASTAMETGRHVVKYLEEYKPENGLGNKPSIPTSSRVTMHDSISTAHKGVPEGGSVKISDPLPGNAYIVECRGKDEKDFTEYSIQLAERGSGGFIGAVINGLLGAATEEERGVLVLSKENALRVADAVIAIAKEIKFYESKLPEVLKIKDRCASVVEKLGNMTAVLNDEARKEVREVQKLASHFPRLMDQPAASFCPYALKTGNAFLQYVELSLKEYK